MLFNFDEAELTPDMGPLLPGIYTVTTNNAKVKKAKSGTGEYIKAEFHIMDGEFKGRKVYHNFNINNDNQTAQNIGRSELKKLGIVSGFRHLSRPQEMMTRKPFMIQIDNEEYQGKSYARVKKFMDMKGFEPSKAAMEEHKAPASKPEAKAEVDEEVPSWG